MYHQDAISFVLENEFENIIYKESVKLFRSQHFKKASIFPTDFKSDGSVCFITILDQWISTTLHTSRHVWKASAIGLYVQQFDQTNSKQNTEFCIAGPLGQQKDFVEVHQIRYFIK